MPCRRTQNGRAALFLLEGSMDLGTRRAALDDFYALLAELEERVGGKRMLENCNGRTDWPHRGVYFFFEEGEYREDGKTPRVVRVGTHALGPSRPTLWGRLSQHRGTDGGSTPGGGNHRGSIFRRHVGAAWNGRQVHQGLHVDKSLSPPVNLFFAT